MSTPDPTSHYQPFYCEENVWQLCDQHGFGDGAHVVFISNAQRTCALWSQRAAPTPQAPVVWDYHVILIDDVQPDVLVWDLDTHLGAPVPFELWWQATFPLEDALPAQFQPCFRVIPADLFCAKFSSDRSHMRTDDNTYRAAPPSWEPIFRPDEGMNLDRFIDMDDAFVGQVMDAADFRRRFVPRP